MAESVFTYPEALAYLQSFEQSTIKLGLQRMDALLAALGSPEKALQTVHVAGTNGKGSVAAMLDSLLAARNQFVGRYVSPHLVSPRERVMVDGRPITRQWFAAALSHIRDVLSDTGIQPSYFELVTALALYAFRFLNVDRAVMETGLGGRLDATNRVSPACTIITSVDLDHTSILGRSIEAIAREKAGILKPGVPLVTWRDTAAWPVLQTEARRRSVPVVALSPEQVAVSNDPFPEVEVRVDGVRFGARSPLMGKFQGKNLALALTAWHVLTGETGDATAALAETVWPGRMEWLPLTPPVLLDGAHNPAAMDELMRALGEPMPGDGVVFGCMRDKAGLEMLSSLRRRFNHVVLTAGSYHRFMSREDFQTAGVRDLPFVPLERVPDAWRDWSRVLVTGSLHLIGDVLQVLAGNPENREVLCARPPYSDLFDRDPA